MCKPKNADYVNKYRMISTYIIKINLVYQFETE